MALLHRGFSFRASTAFLSLAIASLAVGVLLVQIIERFGISRLESLPLIALLAAFPLMTLCGFVSSVIYLVWQRRVQHLVELLVSVGLLAWLSTWEWP
jgi:hypothetical protein